jgi:hypothetical protein
LAETFALDEEDVRRVIKEVWSRFVGQQVNAGQVAGSRTAPGLFGLIKRRREHLFKLPQADPILPAEMGEYPKYQSDIIRSTHSELVSRLLENKFRVVISANPDTDKSRSIADRAEWVLTYGATQLQERSRRDWQKALAEGASGYCYGTLKCTLTDLADADDYGYAESLPSDPKERKKWQLTKDAVGGEASKGKYREKPGTVLDRSKLSRAKQGLPFHVEVVVPDSTAFIEDESDDPGDAIEVQIKEVGLIDYNGKLAADGLKLKLAAGPDGKAKLTLEDFAPETEVGLERQSPVGQMPSVAGTQHRIAMAEVWTRKEYYEMVSPTLVTGTGEVVIGDADWTLVKQEKHPYQQPPYFRAGATIEENEFDPALKWRPALDGLYNQKPMYDFSRALEMRISTQYAVKSWFIEQMPGTVPQLQGDEEGDSMELVRDANIAKSLPAGAKLVAAETGDLNAAFIRSRELQGEELAAAKPPTGTAPIEATTQPWTANFMLSTSNAYPGMILTEIDRTLVGMIRMMVDVMSKPVEEGGLGVGVYVNGWRLDADGNKVVDPTAVIGMEPEEWSGLWIDVVTDKVSGAMRNTQTQVDLGLLNNPVKVMTPEMFVANTLGVQDATSYMRDVEAYWAIQPMMEGLMRQQLSKTYGTKVVVAADGAFVGSQGQQMDSHQVLGMNGVRPVTPGSPPQPGGGTGPGGGGGAGGGIGVQTMVGLPGLPPLQGSPAAGVPSQPGMPA